MSTLPTGRMLRRGSHGFTLMELLIVIFILGMFCFMLTPRLENIFSGGDLRLASRIIIGEIRNARGVAAYSHRNQVLRMNMDEGLIYPVLMEPVGEGVSPVGLPLPDGVRLEDVVTLSKGVLREGDAMIRFLANGCVEKSLIHLKNETEEIFTLDINPLTGNVILHEGYIDESVVQQRIHAP
ncbi:Tfp pilus assembly protein FimT/FimU [Thermodesulfobacteriota bacterium]